MTFGDSKFRRNLLRKSVLLSVVAILFLGVIVFVPAGIKWRRGWQFFFVFCFFTFLSALYLWRVKWHFSIASRLANVEPSFRSNSQA
jgi:hypothetical protein